jgi:hypothetical protein
MRKIDVHESILSKTFSLRAYLQKYMFKFYIYRHVRETHKKTIDTNCCCSMWAQRACGASSQFTSTSEAHTKRSRIRVHSTVAASITAFPFRPSAFFPGRILATRQPASPKPTDLVLRGRGRPGDSAPPNCAYIYTWDPVAPSRIKSSLSHLGSSAAVVTVRHHRQSPPSPIVYSQPASFEIPPRYHYLTLLGGCLSVPACPPRRWIRWGRAEAARSGWGWEQAEAEASPPPPPRWTRRGRWTSPGTRPASSPPSSESCPWTI